jgi:hypothetical protein
MKNTKIFASVLIILAVVLVAGCGDDDTKGQAGYGEDSIDMIFDTEGRSVFDSNEDFIITMTVENFGPFDVENVKTKLIGFGGLTTVGTPLSTDVLLATKLDRPRPELEVAGGFATKDWEVVAPNVSADSPDVEVLLTSEVYYRTKSLGVQKVVVAEKDYIDKLAARGEIIPVNPMTDSMNGPISLDMAVPDPYVTIRQENESLRVKISLDNDGSGTVYARPDLSEGKNTDYLESVTLKVPVGLRVDLANCDFDITVVDGWTADATATNSSKEKILYIDGTSTAKLPKLRLMEGGLRRDLACTLLVDKETYVSGYQTFELYAQADYSYMQDAIRSVIISGT